MQQNHTPNGNKDRPDSQEQTQLTAGGASGTTTDEFQAGDVIGGTYQVLHWIGAGGMGNVYCVRHTIMQTEYALKTLSADKVTEVAWRRFQIEAQAIARMSHPNIVGIYNLGLHDGRLPYYVMDLLKGQSLMDVLRDQGAMEVTRALGLFAELASGFGYAHKKGIVHRDIKPPNIVLLDKPEPSARVKIVDFGIAKLSGVKDPKNQYLTNIGEVCGSPYYMSPEQTEGQRIDARSDVYSLGCTLFEVLTGVPPFRGRSAVDTMLMHQTSVAPTLKVASSGREFPEMLERVIATLLAKAPMDRYQTMELLAQDLNNIIAGEQAAINPYATQSPKPLRLQDLTDQEGRRTGIVERPEQNLPHRRQYEADGGDDAVEESKNSRTRLILMVCALVSLIAVLTGGAFWWQGQVKPLAIKQIANQPIRAADLDDSLARGPEEFPAADKIIDRDERNNSSAANSIKDTAPFATLGPAQGPRLKVFRFPTDITIGDIGSSRREEMPARGKLTFGANEQMFFSADKILLKYPQYLSRFKPGDLYCLKLEGPGVNDELLKLTTVLPLLSKLKLDDCPNLTEKCLPSIDKMPSLLDLELHGRSLSTESLLHLNRLRKLCRLGFCGRSKTDSLLKKLQGSDALAKITLDGSSVSRQGFEYIATLPNLVMLSLDRAKFASEDLQGLSAMPKLKMISLTGRKVDARTFINLRKIKSLKNIVISEGTAYPVPDAEVHTHLPGVRIDIQVERKKDDLPIIPDASIQ